VQNKLLTILFVLIITLPTLDSIFHFSPVKDLFEKRLPAAKPKFPHSFSEIKNYPKNFEKFFDDNYGFRKTLIAINADITDDIFDESPDARAVIGKDDWLYFDNHNSLLDATGRAILSDELVARGVESFGKNWQEMRKKNIKYLLIIAADKSSIYPEFLPDYIKPSEPHRIDKFLNALKKKYPDFPVLDLRPILKKAKEKEIIYQKTDTHWNRRGAHYAYVEIMKILGIKPHLRNEFTDVDGGLMRGDISEIMNSNATNINFELEPKFPVTFSFAFSQNFHPDESVKRQMAGFYNPTVYRNSNKNLPVAFVYKDSFFADIAGFSAEHLSMLFSANEFPCDLNYEIIKNFHPNVVIQEFWEGRIEVVLRRCNNN
jgi:alginate O-acetyltransferase complex protein AlgJ